MKLLYLALQYLYNFRNNYRYKIYRKKYNIHPTFNFNGSNIYFYGDGEIVINENSYIGDYSTLQANKGYRIEIGKGCSISHNVRVYTESRVPDYDFSNKAAVSKKGGSVSIGNFAWIGANVFINPKVNIGDNSVIGANAVVSNDVLPNSINGGVPSKLIRMKRLNNEGKT